ncbi:MAG: PIG-L family deacetylase [Caldilineaceae bacterium]|nr:PIG-L family deacetylase [Caldilineaceae bacterium]MCB9147226.1 PIG-L family deacetylase [Caldilineaceae bacterium]
MDAQAPATQPDWEEVERALVIMAHPDDPDFSCAGTAIKMVQKGIDVTFMILTNGDKGNHNPEITRNQLIELRKIEQRAAAAVEGVQHVLFMGVEDGFLQSTPDLRKRVTREIRRIQPQLIITSSPDRYFGGNGYINHPDHRNAGIVTLESIFPATDNMMFFPELLDEGYLPHKIKQLYIMGDAQVDLKIDITEVFEQKIEAIICHKTQVREPEKLQERMTQRAGQEQEDGSVRFFEQFRVLKFG